MVAAGRALLLIAWLLAAATPLLAGEESPCSVTMLRIGLQDGAVRLVVECDRLPPWQVYLEKCAIVVDMPDTVVHGAMRLPELPAGADFITGITLRQVNFRRARLVIEGAYPLAPEQIKAFALSDPARLVIDIAPQFSREAPFKVTPGVTWRTVEVGTGSRYLLVSILEVSLRSRGVAIDAGLPRTPPPSRERTSVIARTSGALAAVNGGFFHGKGDILSLLVKDGSVVARDPSWRPPRTALGVTAGGKVLMNRVHYGKKGLETVLPEGDGQPPVEQWRAVRTAVGGGPRLLLAGKPHLTTREEALGPGGNDITRVAARTLAATLPGDRLLLATVCGDQDTHSQGMTLEEAAAFLAGRGAIDAMALDGGSSSTMALLGSRIGAPPGGRAPEYKVSDALLVRDESAPLLPYMIDLNVSIKSMEADGSGAAQLRGRVRNSRGKRVPDGTVVALESVPGGLVPGRVKTRKGRFVLPVKALRLPGEVSFRATCGLAEGVAHLTLTAGAPSRIHHRLVASSSPESAQGELCLEVLVTDRHFNPLARRGVRLEATGAPAQETETDAGGIARFRLAPLPAGTRAKVLSEGLPAVDIEIRAPAPAPTPMER